MIVIVNFEINEDFSNTPLIQNLKQTLCLTYFCDAFPELWKLDDLYMENVSEYLKIKKTQLLYTHLWGISIDHSNKVGLITTDKFFPVIKY